MSIAFVVGLIFAVAVGLGAAVTLVFTIIETIRRSRTWR